VEGLKSLSIKVAAGVTVGSLCSALLWVPQIRDLEQEAGLRWLFKLRGPLDPPENAVLVTMSERAGRDIFLPRDPEKYHRCIDLRIGTGTDHHESLPPIPARWPRCLHAILIDKLNRAGARTIVFDVLFRQRAPQAGLHGDVNAEQDAMVARAMSAAGNVVIAQKFEPIGGDSKETDERPLTLSAPIESAALGAGPLQLLPSSNRRVDLHDVFKIEGWATPGLPILALQAYSLEAYPAFRDLLAAKSREAAEFLPATVEELKKGRLQATGLLLRQIFKRDPSLVERLKHASAKPAVPSTDPSHLDLVNALVSAYSGEASRILNFMGPAGRIPATGFDKVLGLSDPMPDGDQNKFRGKAVFVGYAEAAQAEQVEHFSTVFSTADGIDLSGVEIAATAFVNLLEDSSIRPAPRWCSVLVVFFSGLAASLLGLLLRIRIAIPIAAALAAGYLWLAVHLFHIEHLWLPIVAPLLISGPTGIAYAVARKYSDTRRQRDRVRAAFRHFVPSDVANELESNAGRIVATRKSLECICVATDAAQFTTFAESMASESVTDFLNEYFDSLFKPVLDHDGFVSDVVGDAMLAIWPDKGKETRQGVCTALLEMRDAADEFNRRSADNRMATRFGANWGKVTLATVGARAHYEYRAVGDTVNTSSRIQELNKKFDTRILVSHSLVAGVEGFAVRDLGLFLLRGRETPERIYELIQTKARATPAQLELVSEFGEALQTLHFGKKAAALAAFQGIRARHPSDGVTAFYVEYLLADKPLAGNVVVLD
jgi:adenylate cyclase